MGQQPIPAKALQKIGLYAADLHSARRLELGMGRNETSRGLGWVTPARQLIHAKEVACRGRALARHVRTVRNLPPGWIQPTEEMEKQNEHDEIEHAGLGTS